MRSLTRELDMAIGDFGGMFCFLFVIGFIALVAFLSAVDRVLKRVEPENRRMEPGQVWLNLIPFFNLLWMVVTVERVGESIRNEFFSRGRHKKSESYGKTSGLACMMLCGIGIPSMMVAAPCILVFWFFALIYWLVYWVQISNYAKRLKTEGGSFTVPTDEGW